MCGDHFRMHRNIESLCCALCPICRQIILQKKKKLTEKKFFKKVIFVTTRDGGVKGKETG